MSSIAKKDVDRIFAVDLINRPFSPKKRNFFIFFMARPIFYHFHFKSPWTTKSKSAPRGAT
jgi:hypothetical protein